MHKKLLQLIVAIILLGSIPLHVHAEGDVVNSETVNTDAINGESVNSTVYSDTVNGETDNAAITDVNGNGQEKIVLYQGTNKMNHNGKAVVATQPLTAVKGVTYVAARSIISELYGTIAYDAKKKQYVMKAGQTELRFTIGKIPYSLNGAVQYNGIGAPYSLKGTLMVPIRTIALNFGLTFTAYPQTKTLELTWETKPSAKFTVSTTETYAQQTEVFYEDQSSQPRGLQIVDERWENNNTIFEEAGVYEVTHWVQDEAGVWSDPYTVIITDKPPNQPPVASFSTDKDTYRMGEYINYQDLSTDDENRIVKTEWTNNEHGFFVPGTQIVTLKVTDANGAVNEFSKTLTILNESQYSLEEFNLLYTEPGEKFGISGPDVLNLPQMSYSINAQPQTLIRANSPETIVDEGIYYQDVVNGNVRLLIHNYNSRSTPVNIYIVATNEVNNGDATVKVGPVGIGGPNPYVSTVGRAATGRYLASRLNPQYSSTIIPPGQSRLLVPEYSSKTLKPEDVYSMLADLELDKPLKIQIVVVNSSRDVLSYLPNLSILPSNVSHIRGTFEEANRVMIVNQTIGDVKSRMILADNVVDTRLPGIDMTTNTPVLNAGNYGTLYTVRLNNVQPHTAIVVNPRGGYYAGAFNVNGKTVYATNSSILSNPNEVGMLYKTGDSVESVNIVFTPASGSSLPINLLFLPIPSPRP
jgi:PKD repeat protein